MEDLSRRVRVGCARDVRAGAFARPVKRCNEAKCGKKDFSPPKRDENGRVSGAQLEGRGKDEISTIDTFHSSLLRRLETPEIAKGIDV